MKLNQSTLEVLKNFSQINQGIVFKSGTIQSTMSPDMSIIATISIEDTIPIEAAFVNLSEFLGIISAMDNPELTFKDDRVVLNDGEMQLQYRYSDKKLIITPPDKELNMQEPDIKFTLTGKQLQKLIKTASILGLPNIIAIADEDGITVKVDETGNDLSNEAAIQLTIEPQEKKVKVVWPVENLKLLPDNYTITASTKGISLFENENGSKKYFVALQVK